MPEARERTMENDNNNNEQQRTTTTTTTKKQSCKPAGDRKSEALQRAGPGRAPFGKSQTAPVLDPGPRSRPRAASVVHFRIYLLHAVRCIYLSTSYKSLYNIYNIYNINITQYKSDSELTSSLLLVFLIVLVRVSPLLSRNLLKRTVQERIQSFQIVRMFNIFILSFLKYPL